MLTADLFVVCARLADIGGYHQAFHLTNSPTLPLDYAHVIA